MKTYYASWKKDGGHKGSIESDDKSKVDKFVADAKKDPKTQEIWQQGRRVYLRYFKN